MSSPAEIPFSVWRKIAMASWRPRKDPMIAATLDVDAGPILDYIDQVRRATGVRVTPAHLVGRAAAKVSEALPGLNGRVVFGSFAPSPTIDGFFVVSLRTDPIALCTSIKAAPAAPLARRQRRARPWRPARRTPGRARAHTRIIGLIRESASAALPSCPGCDCSARADAPRASSRHRSPEAAPRWLRGHTITISRAQAKGEVPPASRHVLLRARRPGTR